MFDSTKPAGTPKQRFAYLFPSRESALVSVRLKAGLTERERTHTIALIRQAVAMKQWRLQHGESYLVTGQPVIVADLTGKITHSIELLLVAVMLVMAGTLSLVFRGRPRLLPLAIALLAAALTFGALSVVGASLTVASIAVLPVLVGLAVDYAIQFQSRVEEAFAEGAEATRRDGGRRARRCVGAPTIATAGIASVGGDARAAALAGADGAGLRSVARGGRRDRVPVRAHRGVGRARAGRSPIAQSRCRASPGAAGRSAAGPPAHRVCARERALDASWAPPGGAHASCCWTTR